MLALAQSDVQGHFVREIGPAGNVDAETEAIMIEYGFSSQPFGDVQVSSSPFALSHA